MNKSIPLILLCVICLVICLSFGWFGHYSIVPKTTCITEYVIDTLVIFETTIDTFTLPTNNKTARHIEEFQEIILSTYLDIQPQPYTIDTIFIELSSVTLFGDTISMYFAPEVYQNFYSNLKEIVQ